MRRASTPPAGGFTLVELLVVLAVIGLLAGLLLSAVQAARDAAQGAYCRNNLKQIGLAAQVHHDAHRHFPTGGWGHEWVGVPGRGFGRRQPGGWIYNLLPFLEYRWLYDLGQGGDEAERRASSAERLGTPIAVFNCPLRRGSEAWPTVDLAPHLRNPRETDTVLAVARSDYAANGGDYILQYFPGPSTLADGDDPSYAWPDTSDYNGIVYLRSRVSVRGVADGQSNTYLFGEKYLNPDNYYNGVDPGDNESMYNGYCADSIRFTRLVWGPQRDEPGTTDPFRFGGVHTLSFPMVFCDGSVHNVAYDIEPTVFAQHGNRKDGT